MAVPIVPIVAAGLSLLPKIPELWKGIAGIFGKDVPDSVEKAGELVEAIVGDFKNGAVTPEQEIQLKSLLYQHEEKLIEMRLREQEMYLSDTADARAMHVKTTEATGKRDTAMYLLATVVVVGFFSLIAILMQVSLPPGSKDVSYMLFGALAAGFGQVLQFFFGSSKGSADKNALLIGKK